MVHHPVRKSQIRREHLLPGREIHATEPSGSSSHWRIQLQRLIPKIWGGSVRGGGFHASENRDHRLGWRAIFRENTLHSTNSTIICKSMVFANIFSFDLVRHNIFVEILALLADLRKAKRNCYHVCLSFLILKELYLDEVLLRFHKKFLSNLNHNVSRHCSLKS